MVIVTILMIFGGNYCDGKDLSTTTRHPMEAAASFGFAVLPLASTRVHLGLQTLIQSFHCLTDFLHFQVNLQVSHSFGWLTGGKEVNNV